MLKIMSFGKRGEDDQDQDVEKRSFSSIRIRGDGIWKLFINLNKFKILIFRWTSIERSFKNDDAYQKSDFQRTK